jgi:hypothetical protein
LEQVSVAVPFVEPTCTGEEFTTKLLSYTPRASRRLAMVAMEYQPTADEEIDLEVNKGS